MKKYFLRTFIVVCLILFYGIPSNIFSQNGEEEVFTIVETMPEFKGGKKAMMEFIYSNLQYPADAIENGIEGKVFVGFVIEKNGKVSNIKILRGIGYGCDEETIRVISSMPKWTPGEQEGKKVRVAYNLPFTFKLQSSKDMTIYYEADSLPAFYGGAEALNGFINSQLKYPTSVVNNKTIDTIDILFLVEPQGNISSVSLKEKKDKLNALDHEALRVVSELPEFAPGYIGGEAKRVVLYQPIIFDYRNADIEIMELVMQQFGGKDLLFYQFKVFNNPEIMPIFPGGPDSLNNFIISNMNFPESETLNNDKIVFINLTIERDGSFSDAAIIKGSSTALNNEAIRLITIMPRWNPGYFKGKPIRASYNMKIDFSKMNTDR